MKERALICDSHGRRPWSGQVICTACGAVWHLNVDSPPNAPLCTCGAHLTRRDAEGKSIGTARAICDRCYQGLKAQRGASS